MNLVEKLRRCSAGLIKTYDSSGHVIERRLAGMYDDVVEMASSIGAAGLPPRSCVAIVGPTNYLWLIVDLALQHLDMISICPPDEAIGTGELSQLMDRYGLSLVIATNTATLTRVQGVPSSILASDILAGAVVKPSKQRPITIEPDVFTIAFSSGTTGSFKSLKICRSGIQNTIMLSSALWNIEPTDNILIALPFSSMQNRTLAYTAIWNDCSLSVVPTYRLVTAYRDLRPSVLIGPPSFYKLVADRYLAMSRSSRAAVSLFSVIVDHVLPRRVARALKSRVSLQILGYFGPEMRLMVVGSAPCARRLLEAFDSLRLPLYEAYGMTEFGWVAFNLPCQNAIGSVGVPPKGVTIRFGNDGEILVSGPLPQALGYADASVNESANTFHAHHTVATGDCGHLSVDGFLYLDGRKKNVLINRGGEKINAETVERAIESLSHVDAAVVTPFGQTDSVIALLKCAEDLAEDAHAGLRSEVGEILVSYRLDALTARVVLETNAATWGQMMTRNFKVDRNAVVARYGVRS